ncbi:MAG: tRNA pseudouridine(38-40) synthase TruA [Salibacteraceae bacterium]
MRTEIHSVGCGRTDTGVHAEQFFAHFDTDETLDLDDFIYRLNSVLPREIAVQKMFEVAADAHARFSALDRTYEYRLVLKKDPFSVNRRMYMRTPPDLIRMNEACKLLVGEKDFSCFSKSNTQTSTNLCNVMAANWVEDEKGPVFKIKANRFLRNMVRAIVGTCLEIGLGKQPPKHMGDVIESKNRSFAGASVEAHGLYLCQISYPETIFLAQHGRSK